MDHALEGQGLYTASERLAALAGDTARLARARSRFSKSPPSPSSLPSTPLEGSKPPTDEQQRYDDRWGMLRSEHISSWPRRQFDSEALEEGRRVLEKKIEEENYRWAGDCADLPPSEFWDSGRDIVRERWYEQGIWNDTWNPNVPDGPWKHEGPLDLKSESDSENDTKPRSRSLFAPPTEPEAPKSEDELKRLPGRQVKREAEREASRPFHRFIQQVSEERERIRGKAKPADPDAWDPVDINTTAYDNVKNRWVKRGIWDHHWGTLPGMNWKHETEWEEWLLQELGPRPATPPKPDEDDHSQDRLLESLLDKVLGVPAVLDQTSSEQPDVPIESRQDEPASVTAESPPRRSEEPRPSRSVRSGRDRRGADTARGQAVSTRRVAKPTPQKGKANGRRGIKKTSAEVPPAAPNSPEPTRRSRRLRAKKP